MRARGMFPTLLFGMESMSFTAFCDLITYMEAEEEREYSVLHKLGASINPSVDEFNRAMDEYHDKLGKVGSASHPEIQKLEASLKARRESITVYIMELIKDAIKRCITKKSKYPTPLPGWNKGVYIEGAELPDDPSPELVDLCDFYKAYDMVLDNPKMETLPCVSESKGSFFKFGMNTHHIFNDMRLKKKSKQIDKFRDVMTAMAKAEGLEDSQMWKFIDFIGRGLDFGICSLLKEFPFFIQYQILEMMKEKHIAAVFASESLSMGINYPLRSVVIFSKEPKAYPVSKMLQMAGRCGRRGLDTKSYVVYWGIENYAVESDPVERIKFPDTEYEIEKKTIMDIMSGPKEDAQASYVRYYKDYTPEEQEIIKDWYSAQCVKEYRESYNM